MSCVLELGRALCPTGQHSDPMQPTVKLEESPRATVLPYLCSMHDG